jgi:hypothetical protein
LGAVPAGIWICMVVLIFFVVVVLCCPRDCGVMGCPLPRAGLRCDGCAGPRRCRGCEFARLRSLSVASRRYIRLTALLRTPSAKQSAALGDAARPGSPSSRAHRSSRGRRRMDGCRRAGTLSRLGNPEPFSVLNRFAIGWPEGSVSRDAGRAAIRGTHFVVVRRTSAASSVVVRVRRAATQRCYSCPGTSL